MNRRIAIPVTHGKLSETFGTCQHYEIFELDGNRIHKQETAYPAVTAADGLPQWLYDQGITDVITYKVNPAIINRFVAGKINLFVGIASETPQRLIEDYIQGKLESDESVISEITLT